MSQSSYYMKMDEPMTLRDLFAHKLQALYDVETQLVKALPKMAENASDVELKKAFNEHLEQTKGHVDRLEQAFDMNKQKPKKLKVDGIRGIIDDAEWVIKNVSGATALDANLAAAAQYAEFYEMAGYGSAIEWAKLLNKHDIAALLQENMDEERAASDMLIKLAASKLDQEALGEEENTEE